MMKIKVCGMTKSDNIAGLVSLGPDMMGFIFYPKSPRYAGGLAPDAVKSLPGAIVPVAVFVDSSPAEIIDVCRRYGITTVQLHGSESPDSCKSLRERGYTVVKAIGLRDNLDCESIRAYEGAVDMFLFDTSSATHGGTGRKFDWEILSHYDLDTPYMLSGGIGPGDADAILVAAGPKMVGIDLNSRFETKPGVKDLNLLKEFFNTLNQKTTK